MSARMQRAIDDAVRYSNGVDEALDEIFELREEGEEPSKEDLQRIAQLVENLATHEALAEFDL